MLAILSVTFPFFALIGIGYLAARTGALPISAVPGLNVFVLYFALTAMLFELGMSTPIAQLLDPAVLGVWLMAGLGVMAIGLVPARRRGMSWLDASFGGLIAVMSNSGFMGVPLLLALVGRAAAGPVSASLLVDLVLLQSIAIGLAHLGGRGQGDSFWGQVTSSATRVARNPLPWAIVGGGLAGWVGLVLPAPLQSVVSMLGAAATPVALFTIGAVLAREQVSAGVDRDKGDEQTFPSSRRGRIGTGARPFGDVAWLAGLKLFAHPLLVWGLGTAVRAAGVPLSSTALTVLVLTAALPAAANVAVLAERYGADSGRIARVILVSTVLSYATFTAAVALQT